MIYGQIIRSEEKIKQIGLRGWLNILDRDVLEQSLEYKITSVRPEYLNVLTNLII